MRVYSVSAAVVTLLFAGGLAAALDFDKLDRRIAKEPDYQSKPLYGLAILGSDAKMHVWMVLDGERLYVDKNCNGDLTDDGPPAELKNKDTDPASFEDIEVTPDSGRTVYKFEVTNQSVHVTFPDGRWFGAWGDHHAPLMFSSSAVKAPAMHFGGALRMGFDVRNPIERVAGGFQLSACVGTPGSAPGAWVHLLYKTIPRDVHPKVELEFQPEVAGGQPVRVRFTLGQRC